MVIVTVNTHQYYMNENYKNFVVDKILPRYINRNWQVVAVVEGKPGAGKTTLAIQTAYYLDPTFNNDRIAFNVPQFEKAILNATPGQAVIFDEAVIAMLSLDVFKDTTTRLIKLITQCRKRRLIIFLLIPSIFMLQKYFAISLTDFDLRVLSNQGNRGNFLFYNEERKLDLIIKSQGTFKYRANPSLPIMSFTKYCPIDLGEGSDYDKKKDEAMAHKEFNKKDKTTELIWLIHDEYKLGATRLSALMKKYKIPITIDMMRGIIAKGKPDGT